MYTHTVTEVWVPIAQFEDHYRVSNYGRVKSLQRTVQFVDGRVRTFPSKILRQRVWSNGYRCVALYKNAQLIVRTVHSLVAEAFLDKPDEENEVCHKDGDRTNNFLGNLYYGTKSSNALDSVKHGTHFNASKKFCPRNHELVEPNLMRSNAHAKGRACLACSRGRATVSNNKRRGIELDLKTEADKHYLKIMKTTSYPTN